MLIFNTINTLTYDETGIHRTYCKCECYLMLLVLMICRTRNNKTNDFEAYFLLTLWILELVSIDRRIRSNILSLNKKARLKFISMAGVYHGSWLHAEMIQLLSKWFILFPSTTTRIIFHALNGMVMEMGFTSLCNGWISKSSAPEINLWR